TRGEVGGTDEQEGDAARGCNRRAATSVGRREPRRSADVHAGPRARIFARAAYEGAGAVAPSAAGADDADRAARDRREPACNVRGRPDVGVVKGGAMHQDIIDVAVVGGGLGGLTTATYLARAGRSVVVLERATAVGGRAATHVRSGFHLNQGPHALYRSGEGARVLAELGVAWSGGVPPVTGGMAVSGDRCHALPGGFLSLATTGL